MTVDGACTSSAAKAERDVVVFLAGGDLRVVWAQHDVDDDAVLCGP